MESEVLTVQKLANPSVSKSQRNFVKRMFDLAFSLIFMAVSAPFFLSIIVIIRLSSKGSAIYVQPRLGRDGKVFKCYKFRTMYVDAEEKLQELLTNSPCLQKEWSCHQKLKNDPRIFPLGKWLRRTSLDELPQFWNVIKGDLSVVGPRPYMISQKNELGALTSKILSVRPGITGLWQTSGRSKTSFQERITLDAQYVDRRSFWYDLVLIIKTIPEVLFSRNAY